ncbi:MAG: DUF3572 family protein [Rhodobacteraceae bacterium]|nr:DUF3572 family protein [Paracoccaceae bacterium]
MSEEAAGILAIKALGYLAGQEDLLQVFLNTTGLAAESLKERLDDPDLQAAVLDFLLMDDAWVLGFADAHRIAAEHVAAARAALPGGDLPHWT